MVFKRIVLLTVVCLLIIPASLFAQTNELSLYWNPDHLYKVYDEVIDAFAKEKGLKINKQVMGWTDFKTKINADFAAGNPPDIIEVPSPWIAEFGAMGLRVLTLSPDEHDREAAYTQGITHFMGRVLDDLQLKPSKIGTKGYEKLLDIIEQTCNDPLQLFLDLQRYNPYTQQMRDRLRSSIEKVQDQL